MSGLILAEVALRARNVLKALKGSESEEGKEKPAAVPVAPASEDRTDPRVGDASPTQEDLDAAAKPDDDDPDGLGEDGDDAAGEGDAPKGEGSDDAASEGGEDGFDEFGHKDMDPREVKKAFPKIGHLFPDEALDELEDNETAAGAKPSILGELMSALSGMKDVMANITAELERLKKGYHSQARELKKALDANEALTTGQASIEDRLNKIHETAPAAGGARAVTKALTPQADASQSFSTPELTQLAASKTLGSHEIALLCITGPRS